MNLFRKLDNGLQYIYMAFFILRGQSVLQTIYRDHFAHHWQAAISGCLCLIVTIYYSFPIENKVCWFQFNQQRQCRSGRSCSTFHSEIWLTHEVLVLFWKMTESLTIISIDITCWWQEAEVYHLILRKFNGTYLLFFWWGLFLNYQTCLGKRILILQVLQRAFIVNWGSDLIET